MAALQSELVTRHGWLSREKYGLVYGLARITPGTNILAFCAGTAWELKGWPGAILATVLWLPATTGFAWYVRNITNYNVLYGSVGTGIALLVWMYLLAAIALFGCEFNAELERMRMALSATRRRA